MARGRTGLFLSACAVFIAVSAARPEGVPGMKNGERCSLWIDVLKGEPVSFGEMIKDCATARIVYIGEVHTIRRHHEIQERIIRELCGSGRKVLLGLEQMEAFNQEYLDLYNKGTIDFTTLAIKTGWGKRWSNYRDYRNAMEEVRNCGGRIIALNARAETVRAVARNGMRSLKEKNNDLPPMVLYPDEPYAALLRKVMSVHGFMQHRDMLENMVNAQIVRDESMAFTITRFLEKGNYKEHVAVVLAGAGHVSFGMGIPDRVRKRLPGVRERIILISESGDLQLNQQQRMMVGDTEISREDLRAVGRPPADYLHITEPAGKQ